MVKFSKANVKIATLAEVAELKPYLENKRKVYSFDLLSGYSCPYANECLSKVVKIGEKKKIKDGPNCKFRCFSASQEIAFPNVYNSRKANFDALRGKSQSEMIDIIEDVMPANCGICRIHVAGDFFNQDYFNAWLSLANYYPDKLFYAYTKSLTFWLASKSIIPNNLILTASRGGRLDNIIVPNNLRSVKVINYEHEAKGLEIDHNDSCAARPSMRNKDFALLIHGIQPKGSAAAEAVKANRKNGVKFSYSKVKSATTI